MLYITEAESAQIITEDMAYEAMKTAFIAAIQVDADSFPVVFGHGSDRTNRFSVKSAADGHLAGVKIGSYFPSNDAVGLPRHNSMILLFDQSTGKMGAIVEAGRLNAYRTAAGNAVATHCLARPGSKVVALFGTGNQAEYEARAISRIRSLERILVVGRDPERTSAFVRRLVDVGLPAESADADSACRAADIIVTATASRAPLFRADSVRPGTHISSMGSDAIGKQELPPQIFGRARLFCDLPSQSCRIGEFQHAGEASPTAIGFVLTSHAEGRRTAEEITIFDSSGLSLQDLYVGQAVIEAYQRSVFPESA
jgi:ornithine cyclodeaminase